jgi:hypothetical protein
MLLCSLQVVAVLGIALFLGRWKIGVHRRNGQSWESLIARLQHDCNARELTEHFLWREGLTATPEEAWERIQGPKGLRSMYRNAGIMLEMADFAARNGDVDPELLKTLRSDATQIRMCVVQALFQYALSHANESVQLQAFRAASMYTGMAARMAQLMQAHASTALPSFVAAM